MAAAGTTKQVHFPDLFDELSPSFGRHPPRPMVGHIQHRHLRAHRRRRRLITGPEEPVGDDGVKTGMKPGVIPEGVDHHDHPRDAVIEAQHRAEEDLDAFLGTVAQLRQEFPVVFEIDPEQDRDAEDKLAMRDGIKNVVGDIFPELNHSVKNPKIRHPK